MLAKKIYIYICIHTVSIYSKMTSPELCLDLFILCLVFFEACTAVGCLMTAKQRQFQTSYKHTYIISAQFTSLLFPFFLSLYLLYGPCFFFLHSALLQLFIMASHISWSYIRNMKPLSAWILHIISTSVFSNSTWTVLARPWMNFWRLTLEILQLVLCYWRL